MSEQTKVDVLAVMRGAEELALCYSTERHTTAIREARAAVAELVAEVRQARAALNQAATFPADIALARQALDRAVARMGDAVPVTLDAVKVADHNLRDALRWRLFRTRATPGEVRAIVSGPWTPGHKFHALNDVAVDECLARTGGRP